MALGYLASFAAGARAGESFVTTAVYTADPDANDSGVRQVKYSTGREGTRLKWIARTSSGSTPASRPAAEGKATFAQYAEPIDPFDDPFGDARLRSQGSAPKSILRDEPLEPVPSAPLIGSLPQITVDESPQAVEPQPPARPGIELEEALAVQPTPLEKQCDKVKLKRIHEITTDVSASGTLFPAECTFADIPTESRVLPKRQQEGWAPITFTWKASALCHKPLYFEQTQLERYGHSCGPYIQPLVSGAHFFLTVPILPYKMGLYPPNECMYSLGYYRPGNCAPYLLDPLPLSVRASLFQAGAVVGAAALIP